MFEIITNTIAIIAIICQIIELQEGWYKYTELKIIFLDWIFWSFSLSFNLAMGWYKMYTTLIFITWMLCSVTLILKVKRG